MILNPLCSEIVSQLQCKDLEEVRSVLTKMVTNTGVSLFIGLQFSVVTINDKERSITLSMYNIKRSKTPPMLCIPVQPNEVIFKINEQNGKTHTSYVVKLPGTPFNIDLPEISSKTLEGYTIKYQSDYLQGNEQDAFHIFLYDHKPTLFIITPFDEIIVEAEDQYRDNGPGLQDRLFVSFYGTDGILTSKIFSRIVAVTGSYRPSGRYFTYFTDWCAENGYLDLIREPCLVLNFKASTVDELLQILISLAKKNVYLEQCTFVDDWGLMVKDRWYYTPEEMLQNTKDLRSSLSRFFNNPSKTDVKTNGKEFSFNYIGADLRSIAWNPLIYAPNYLEYPLGVYLSPDHTDHLLYDKNGEQLLKIFFYELLPFTRLYCFELSEEQILKQLNL